MNRKELQEIAQIRVREAETLLHNGHFEGAYYLAGYAVECALKVCIAKQTHEHDFPDLKWARKVYTHNLEDLLSLAGLEEERKMREKATRISAATGQLSRTGQRKPVTRWKSTSKRRETWSMQ